MADADEQIVSKPPDLSVLLSWKEFTKTTAKKTRWEWFVIDQFLRGNHSIKAQSGDNTLVIDRRDNSNNINFPINKIFSTFRSIRGYVTKNKPVITVEPNKLAPNPVEYARQANATLERDNQLNNYRYINKEWAYYGIKYGVGYREIGYDPVKKCAIRWTIDPFDLGIGSRYGEVQDAPYIIKTVVRTVGYWKAKYPEDTEDISPDNELADDEYKKLSLQIKYQLDGTTPSNRVDEQTKIGYECYYRVYKPNQLQGTVNKITFVKEKVFDSSFEETPFNEYPLVPYKADITPNEEAGDGGVKHVIAPQRMLNLLNTQALEYNHIVNRGRILKDKNAGFRVINTREGQIIEKKPGANVQVLNPPSVNPLLDRQISYAIQFIEDIGGQHQASQGSTPARVSSGDAIEALQSGDSNNIIDFRDNFEDALAQEAVWILRMYSLFEKKGVTIQVPQTDGKQQTMAVVGNEAYARTGTELPKRVYIKEPGADYCDACAILADNQVKVSITSQLGETREAKLNLLFRLVELGMPLKFVLEYLEFPNTSDILQRIAEQTVADLKMAQLQAQMAPQPGQQQPGMPGGQGAVAPSPDMAQSAPTASASPEGGSLPDIMSQLQNLKGTLSN